MHILWIIIIITIERHIGGAVFLDFSVEDWKEFGISKVGLFYIRRIKEKV